MFLHFGVFFAVPIPRECGLQLCAGCRMGQYGWQEFGVAVINVLLCSGLYAGLWIGIVMLRGSAGLCLHHVFRASPPPI